MQIKRSTLPLISKVGKLSSTLTIPFYTCSPPSVKFWHDANVANRSEQSVTRMISDPKTGLHKFFFYFFFIYNNFARIEHGYTNSMMLIRTSVDPMLQI